MTTSGVNEGFLKVNTPMEPGIMKPLYIEEIKKELEDIQKKLNTLDTEVRLLDHRQRTILHKLEDIKIVGPLKPDVME